MSRVLRGTLMIFGVVMRFAHLPLLCIPSFDIMALHIYGYLLHQDLKAKRGAFILQRLVDNYPCF